MPRMLAACDPAIYELGVPILGICYGMQLMAPVCGGRVERAGKREYGKAELELVSDSALFEGLDSCPDGLDEPQRPVAELPPGFRVDGQHGARARGGHERSGPRTVYGPVPSGSAAHRARQRNAPQFPVRHLRLRGQLDDAILHRGCGAGDPREVGDKKVLCALSGGVDSSVVAALVHKAIGDQLTCMFIDHGLLRKGEADSVMETFAGKFDMNVIKIDASERFLAKLEGVDDPEQKRKIIGNEFICVFEEESAKLGGFRFLAQGTLYTDIIECGTATAQTIKSHHNVGGLPEEMKFKLIEPLKTLFKDEVRKVGEELGLPEEIVWRQPFPGPGLAIRVLGEVTEEKLPIVRESDAILREEIARAGPGPGDLAIFHGRCRTSGASASWATPAPMPTRSASAPSPPSTA